MSNIGLSYCGNCGSTYFGDFRCQCIARTRAALTLAPSTPRTYPTNYLGDAPWMTPVRGWWRDPE